MFLGLQFLPEAFPAPVVVPFGCYPYRPGAWQGRRRLSQKKKAQEAAKPDPDADYVDDDEDYGYDPEFEDDDEDSSVDEDDNEPV